MKKKNLGSKLVKKAITWAMIAMMSLSGVMSNMATMTAYAEENEINNYVDELDLSNEYVDSDKAEYHNDEAAEVAQNSDSVKAMNEQVNKAQDAVAKADVAVTDAEKAVTDAANAASAASNAATDAGNAEEAAAKAANDATEKVKALEDKKTVENIEDYNIQVAADQNNIENNAEADASVKSAEDAAATAAGEADKAKDAAEAAQAALEKALDVDTDKVNQEVQDAVDEANAAAQAAAEAAEAAKDAKTTAEAEANKIIAEYNLYAMSYGLPLYGETTVTYSTEEAKAVVEAAGMVYQAGERARLEDEVKDINDTTLEAEKANVDAAVKALDAAQKALVTAENSAKDAADAAAEASKAVADADATADEAADAVNNYYVTPAQEAVDATNKAIDEKKSQISELDTALENAKAAAKPNGEAAYSKELSAKQSAMDKAKAEYEACPDWRVLTKSNLKKKYDTAKAAYDAYNTQSKKDEVVKDYIRNEAAVSSAASKVATANDELVKLNEQYAAQAGVLAAENATKEAYMQEAEKNAQEEARKEFVKEIEKILSNYSGEINQIDYDEDLNAWANDVFNTWHLIDKGKVRNEMNNKYVDSTLESLFNTLGITQWAVDTDSAEKVMDAARSAYRESIEDYYEKLAVVETNWAAMDTEAAKKAVEEEVKKMDAVNATISNAKDFVENASDQLDKAKDAYDAAEERLNKLQESVNQKTFDSITLKALQDKIAAAQAAVKAADDELKKAEVQKAAAQNYANWANQLVTDHYTRAYAQVTKDADGNNTLLTENLKQYDLKNDEVISRSTNDFTCVSPGTDSVKVPYAIYRDYVEAMYKKYQADQVNSGKGTSTGDNMDVIYWEVDENGVLTGKYFDSIDDLSTGRYFVGYSFKQEKDGYHLDGVMWDYTKEAEPTVTPAPAGGGSDGSGPSGDGGTSTVTIVDGAVALAAAPNADQAVLGARRVPNADQAVLGAKRGVDQAVLGKRRRPETGDSAAVILWMMALAVSAATAVVATMQLKKKKENE